jgi:hypothetical protein
MVLAQIFWATSCPSRGFLGKPLGQLAQLGQACEFRVAGRGQDPFVCRKELAQKGAVLQVPYDMGARHHRPNLTLVTQSLCQSIVESMGIHRGRGASGCLDGRRPHRRRRRQHALRRRPRRRRRYGRPGPGPSPRRYRSIRSQSIELRRNCTCRTDVPCCHSSNW